MAWAIRDEIGWLTVVSEIELAQLLDNGNEKTNENAGLDVPSGESPDMPGDRRGIPCTTRQDLTRHNQTKQDITQPDKTGPAPGASRGSIDGDDDLVDRWKNATKIFLDLVLEIAARFHRLPDRIRNRPGQEIDKPFILQMAWIGAEFDRGPVDSICDRLASGEISKPKNYAESILRKLCAQHGYEWRLLRLAVPLAESTSKPNDNRKEENDAA